MEAAIYLSLIFGIFMLSLSARQAFTSDEHRLCLSDIPMRVRQTLRRDVQGYWVRKVRVTMEDGRPAYWFTGSTVKDPDVALVVFDSGETVILPSGASWMIENDDVAPPRAPWRSNSEAHAEPLFAAAGQALERHLDSHAVTR
jgi:hypothetical protein